MESHPQNPELRNNPENFHPWILVLMAYEKNTLRHACSCIQQARGLNFSLSLHLHLFFVYLSS